MPENLIIEHGFWAQLSLILATYFSIWKQIVVNYEAIWDIYSWLDFITFIFGFSYVSSIFCASFLFLFGEAHHWPGIRKYGGCGRGLWGPVINLVIDWSHRKYQYFLFCSGPGYNGEGRACSAHNQLIFSPLEPLISGARSKHVHLFI